MPLLATLRSRFISTDPQRCMLWSPVWLMLGIGAYFWLEREPPIYLGAALLAAAIVVLVMSWKRSARLMALPLFLMALGFAAAQGRAHIVATPLLVYPLYNKQVEGVIEEIDPVEKKAKLVLAHPVIEGLPPARTPKRLRVSFRHNDPAWRVGDRLRFTATLYPLPPPNMPGSYDFARHFYFRGIGGDGFALRAPEVVERAAASGFSEWLNNLRHFIGEDMRAHMPGAAGAVAAAMTVGETGPIPQDTKNLLRDAGLSHMLAIAGLHLGIVAGIVFFNARLLLSLYPPLALRIAPKKIAAALALFSALVYLILAGCPIPAQRAFIAVAFLFSAMLLDRRGVTLRTLAFAACLILLLFPESLFGASFQLSFAATLAIIALFERFGGHLNGHDLPWWRKLWRHGLGIACTSLVATLATAPFILYNFNRFASFGLLTNMLVVPLATFVIMPAIVLSLLLMPLGLQAVGYAPLKLGMQWMFALSSWVTSLPYASLRLPSPSDAGLAVSAFGLLALCLWAGRTRLLGLPVILLGLSTLALHKPYDLLISDDASKIALRLSDGQYLFIKGKPLSFAGQVWLRSDGQEDGLTLSDTAIEHDWPDCNEQRCVSNTHGQHIVIARRETDIGQLCKTTADILITGDYADDSVCSDRPLVIDRQYLRRHGAVGIRFGAQGVEVQTAEELRGQRLWSSVAPFH